MTTRLRPERLNLALGHRCFVTCRGCYQFFGQQKPDLKNFATAVAQFVRLGITAVTISGGDPLTVLFLPAFLTELRALGVTSIKLDTVGTGLLEPATKTSPLGIRYRQLEELLAQVDYLGLPLDGWSNETVRLFRTGRPALYNETVALLDAIDQCCEQCQVVINTVVHRQNLHGLRAMLMEVTRHASIKHWNLFQYTPTDQVAERINGEFSLAESAFARACEDLMIAAEQLPAARRAITIETRSARARLGQYLLINSDGESWLPNEHGRTIKLGTIWGQEEAILSAWTEAVEHLCSTEGSSLRATKQSLPLAL